MPQTLPTWPGEARDAFLAFWYCRSQWLYYRTRSVVAARYYEDKMTKTCGWLLDRGLLPAGRPMPKVVLFTKVNDDANPDPAAPGR